MLYFIALFCSPLALLLALRPISAVLNAVLYVGALVGVLFAGVPGVLLWFLGVLHAYAVIRDARADRRARRLAAFTRP